jgi:hypothetical protein
MFVSEGKNCPAECARTNDLRSGQRSRHIVSMQRLQVFQRCPCSPRVFVCSSPQQLTPDREVFAKKCFKCNQPYCFIVSIPKLQGKVPSAKFPVPLNSLDIANFRCATFRDRLNFKASSFSHMIVIEPAKK